MKTYNIIPVALIASALVFSCQRPQEEDVQIDSLITFTACQESEDASKTVITSGTSVFWEPAEEIQIFTADGTGYKYISSNTEPAASAVFSGPLTREDVAVGDEVWALYPFNEEAVFDGETITTTLPYEQVACAESFARGMNLSIARSTTERLQFYNVGGGVRFSITEDGVKKVIFEGLDGGTLSGTISIGFENGLPVVKEVTDGRSYIVLLPPDGEAFQKNAWYYIVAIPGALENGYKLRFFKDDSSWASSSSNSVIIKRAIFGSVQKVDQDAEFVDNEEADTAAQEIMNIVSSVITEDGTVDPGLLADMQSEIESNPIVESVEVGDVAASVTFKTGEVICYPYDFPSAFDGEDEDEVSGVAAELLANGPMKKSSNLDQSYFDADVVIFNLFSEESGRKNQNKLLENAKYVFEHGLMKRSVCYLGLDNFTYENVKKAIEHKSIIFLSTLGSDNGKYICLGDVYVGDNAFKSWDAVSYDTAFLPKFDNKKYEGEKRCALEVAWLLDKYQGPLLYFASCNSLKTDWNYSKNVVGWDGVNKSGQAYALIFADYLVNNRSFGSFLLDFTPTHTQTGEVIDPLVTDSKTTLRHLGGGWSGSNYKGWYDHMWEYGNPYPMKINTPTPGTCVAKKSKYTVSLQYDNPDPTTIITDGKHCVYEKGHKYLLRFDDMSGDALWDGEYLYVKSDGRVDYTSKGLGAGVWKIDLCLNEDDNLYLIGGTYLIMHKKYKGNEGDVEDMPQPEVKTLKAEVGQNGVFFAGVVINRTMEGLKTGFRYWKTSSPNEWQEIASSAIYQEYFGANLPIPDPGHTYKVEAYVVDESGNKTFGDELSFTIEGQGGNDDPTVPDAVDLGLSVKWASCNVGASAPEEYGDYYAWGETEPHYSSLDPLTWKDGKTGYNWAYYQWCNGSYSSLTKYNTDGTYGAIDGKMVLESSDDVAYAKYGDEWRMPTDAEWAELMNNTTQELTTEKGVYGAKFTSTINGKSIFFPAAGHIQGVTPNYMGSYGGYWSATLYEYSTDTAKWMYFDSEGVKWYWNSGTRRCDGHSVRPVYGPNAVPVQGVSLNKTELDLYVGQSYQLTSTLIPENATNKKVYWLAESASIASVSETGLVTGVSPGNTLITVMTLDGGFTAQCTVTVTEAPQVVAVDMGLPSGLKWASWNVGASKPEECGEYFAWGEIEPKTAYTWETYKWCNGSMSSLTKYNTLAEYGTPDYRVILEPEDDVAHVRYGEKWRIPTVEDFYELYEQCDWVWTSLNGVNGYQLTSKTNGNQIFLPTSTFYWQSLLEPVTPYLSHCLVFDSSGVINPHNILADRAELGFAIRAVHGDISLVRVNGISVNTTDLELFVGDTYPLVATIIPSDAYFKGVAWISDNTQVVTVSTKGEVTALSGGTATITAYSYDGGFSASCHVTVNATPVLPVPAAVDMGLSVKWASFNLGASSPEEYGNYYAWGETQTKSDYSWATYKWCEGTNMTITKYCQYSIYGPMDFKSLLDDGDDAAHVKLGGKWRIPKQAEWVTFLQNCTYASTIQNGVKGLMFTSNINGNSIFFPVAGYMDGTSNKDVEVQGIYWSSLDNAGGGPDEAWRTSFRFSDSSSEYSTSTWFSARYFGCTIRPVCDD